MTEKTITIEIPVNALKGKNAVIFWHEGNMSVTCAHDNNKPMTPKDLATYLDVAKCQLLVEFARKSPVPPKKIFGESGYRASERLAKPMMMYALDTRASEIMEEKKEAKKQAEEKAKQDAEWKAAKEKKRAENKIKREAEAQQKAAAKEKAILNQKLRAQQIAKSKRGG